MIRRAGARRLVPSHRSALRAVSAAPPPALAIFAAMPLPAAVAVVALSAALAAMPAVAQSLEPVTVTATRSAQRAFDVPASVDVVDAKEIEAQRPGVNLSEALGRVPGVFMRDRQNFAQDLQVSSRGFGARASFGVRGVRLVQDGVPLTMPDGQGQTGLFDLDSAERIEVLRGPFAALYGNSSGGLVTVFTEDPPQQPTLGLRAGAGSFGMRKLGAAFGASSGAFGARADVSRFRTDGWREHSRTRRDLANARLLWSDDDDHFALGATALDQPDTLDPLGLTRAQLASSPRQAGNGALAFDTRKSIAHNQIGADWRRRIGDGSTLRVRAYGGERTLRQFLAFSGAAPGSSGGVVDLDRGFGGLNVQWTKSVRTATGRIDATLGVDYDRMNERRKGFVNVAGVAGALRRNESDTVRDFDQYAVVEWWVTPQWKLAGGARRSNVRFTVQDAFVDATNPDDSGSRSYSATSPVIGVLYALSDDMNVYASIGRGFETPTFTELAYRPDGRPGLNFGLQASRSTNQELGLKWRASAGTQARVALFRTDTDNDIVPAANVGGRTTFRNAARTARRGIELGVDAEFGHGIAASLAWTWMQAQFRDYRALDGTGLSDKRLPGVPKASLFAEATWRHAASGFVAGAEASWSGKVFVDDANTQHADSYAVANLRAGFELHAARWRIEPFVRVENIFDRRYVGSVIVNAAGGRYYESAPQRSYYAGVRAQAAF
ncbi:MAG: TonB-dependent receptor [Burkholderiaceae bacterium]|nr:TonB-dependent receptor [Burkholderiaceae bacterium]